MWEGGVPTIDSIRVGWDREGAGARVEDKGGDGGRSATVSGRVEKRESREGGLPIDLKEKLAKERPEGDACEEGPLGSSMLDVSCLKKRGGSET